MVRRDGANDGEEEIETRMRTSRRESRTEMIGHVESKSQDDRRSQQEDDGMNRHELMARKKDQAEEAMTTRRIPKLLSQRTHGRFK